MLEETLNEAQELQALKAKESLMLQEVDQLNQELEKLGRNQDLDNMR